MERRTEGKTKKVSVSSNFNRMAVTPITRADFSRNSTSSKDIFIGVPRKGVVTLSKAAMKVIKNATNVNVLVNHKNKQLAIVPAKHARHGNAHTVFCEKANYTKLVGAPFIRLIRDFASAYSASGELSYRIKGNVGKDGKSIVFDTSTVFIR